MAGWRLWLGAIVLEVAGTTAMKWSTGFTRLMPSVLMVACYAAAFAGLTYTLKYIEVSTAYAVWAGVGTALIAAIGFVYFTEPVTLGKLFYSGLILVGVIGLNLVSLNP
jgi:small multidrug resistance pump